MYFSPCCYLTWHTLGRFCDAEVRYEIAHRQQNILQVTFTRFHREGKGSRSVMSDPHRLHGLQSTRFLCAWDFPGKSTGVGCHCLLPDSIGGGNKDGSEKFCLSVRVETPLLLLILWSRGEWTEHDSVLPLFISSLVVFWFDKLMCRSLAFPSYKGSVWHNTDKRPSSCWLSFLRGAEASHSSGALPGPLEHRVQNSDLDLKWSRGRITVGRSCPYAGCQCA